MTEQQWIELSAGDLRLRLSPSIGGAISGFEWRRGDRRAPILRDCPNPLAKVLDASCFPLVPYVNRIRGGRFVFRGREVRLDANMAGDPSPLHGQGWLSPWEVEQAADRNARLGFRHRAGDWPWDYQATQTFELDGSGLTLILACENLGGEPMPCGLGQHPYFPCSPATIIDTQVEVAWTVDEQVLPIERVPAEGRYALKNRTICGQSLDNGFGGWGGVAILSDPAWPFDLELRSPGTRFFQVYSPAEGGIFVAEPVSHANAALNEPEGDWARFGLRVLEPGETMDLTMRLEVIPK